MRVLRFFLGWFIHIVGLCIFRLASKLGSKGSARPSLLAWTHPGFFLRNHWHQMFITACFIPILIYPQPQSVATVGNISGLQLQGQFKGLRSELRNEKWTNESYYSLCVPQRTAASSMTKFEAKHFQLSIYAFSLWLHQGHGPFSPLLGYSSVVSLAPPVTMCLSFIDAPRHTKTAEVACRQDLLLRYICEGYESTRSS